ncbi:hypothetical protein BCL50_1621 [Mycolicibacterium litorale]|nr:hypothetical protein BCL50_1621 [Mycolicibacterium litorale]
MPGITLDGAVAATGRVVTVHGAEGTRQSARKDVAHIGQLRHRAGSLLKELSLSS